MSRDSMIKVCSCVCVYVFVCVVCFYVRDTAMLYVVVLSDNVCAYNYIYSNRAVNKFC